VIALTTGRETSQRLNSLLNDLAHTIPNAKIVRRGKSSIQELTERLVGEGVDYALAIYRTHGGPGRIELLRVQPAAMSAIPPMIMLSSVKLRREYAEHSRYVAQAITFDKAISDQARRFCEVLSRVLRLPTLNLHADTRLKSTLHVSERTDGLIQLVATSPAQRQVGPRLLISRLIWDLHASKQEI